ncbi:MAG: potassium channel family protein [Bacillota bacterium]
MKQFVIIGLGNFGMSIAHTLVDKGYEILAIDKDEEPVQKMADVVTHTVQVDATNEEALRTLRVDNFDVAVVSIGDDVHANTEATLILNELGVSYIVVKAQSELHGKVLKKVGADKIVYPEHDMGRRVAYNLITSNVIDYIDVALGYSIIELQVSDKFIGSTLRELNLRAKFEVNVIAIKKEEEVNIAPSADDQIERGDVLVVMGKEEGLEELKEY